MKKAINRPEEVDGFSLSVFSTIRRIKFGKLSGEPCKINTLASFCNEEKSEIV